MAKLRFLLPAALLVLCANTAPPQAPTGPVAIEIESDWGGLNNSTHSHILILRKDGHYAADGAPVNDGAVAALVAAVAAPPLPDIDLNNLGLDQAWLERHKDDPPEERLNFAQGAPNQQAFYRHAFTDPVTMHAVMEEIDQSYITDTYPHVTVTLTFADRSVVAADSIGQHHFMLPWTVTRGGASNLTYNADIGRAVARFLPQTDSNQTRAAGDGLAHEIVMVFAFHIEDAWRTLGAQNRAGPAIARLQSRYTLVTADISERAYGFTLDSIDPQNEDYLHVQLRRPEFPANFTDSVALSYRNGQGEGVDDFLARAAGFEARALSVPWLTKSMRRGQDGFRLTYVHGTSLDDAEMQAFAADMHGLGKDALAAMVRAVRDKVVLLTSGPDGYDTYWLVLPDRRVILWRFHSRIYPDKWPDVELHLHTKDCANGLSLFESCVGTIVGTDGVLKN